MTTTYYILTNHCECCGREDRVSIGLSAMGWKFLFYTDEHHKSAAAWLIELMREDTLIYDEYGGQISREDFAQLITAKMSFKSSSDYGCSSEGFTTDGDFDYVKRRD